jgi:hypothetical protein
MFRLEKKFKMSENIRTTFSHHSKCFICKRTTGPLRVVSLKSRIDIFLNLKLFIKKKTSACYRHLNQQRDIHKNQYCLIKPLPASPKQADLIEMLNSVGTLSLNCLNEKESADEESLIFEPFKNFALLEENHCLQITNLTKAQFLQVMNILERLRNSKNRTKEQLLALYKYYIMSF